jgi:hypothetical protein
MEPYASISSFPQPVKKDGFAQWERRVRVMSGYGIVEPGSQLDFVRSVIE